MDPGLNRGSERNLRTNHDGESASNNSALGQTSRPVTRSMRSLLAEPIPDNTNARRRAETSSIYPAQGTGSRSQESGSQPPSENESTSSSGHSVATPTPSPSPGRRRTKRRKLDSEDAQEGIQGFRYGHHGQVVSTPLNMEISTCDGPQNGTKVLAKSILLNDRSVYYSDDNRCNFILRHRGDSPFCLKKLVIRTPTSGLDAPSSVREGMVFVSMAMDEVFNRTARYQLTYPDNPWPQRACDPTTRRYFEVIRSLLTSPPRGSADVPQQSSAGEQLQQHSDLSVTMERDDKTEEENFDNDNRQDGFSLSDVEDTQSETSNSGGADEDDNISGLLEALAHHLDVRQQRLLEALGVTEPFVRLRSRTFRQMRCSQPQTVLVPPHERNAAGPSSPPPSSPSGVQLMKPHARFYIEKDKNMVSIKFDPPASGRFILLKLWTPFSRGMEIQNVIPHGFAGPRYFPAVQFR